VIRPSFTLTDDFNNVNITGIMTSTRVKDTPSILMYCLPVTTCFEIYNVLTVLTAMLLG